MKINISEIADSRELKYKEDDLSFFESMKEDSLGEIEIKEPVSVDISIKNQRPKFYVTGAIKGAMTLGCSRCIKSYGLSFDSKFSMTLEQVRDDDLADIHEIELTDQDLQVEQFTGDEIDVTRIVQEQIVLLCPMQPLCKEDCKGLCSQCGGNLNEVDCGCEIEEKENTFSILKNIT